MALAVGALIAPDGIAIERLRKTEVAHVLRHDRETAQPHRHARVIVAQNAAVYFQRALIGLFGERPLLLTDVNLAEIVQHRGNVALRSVPRLQNAEALLIEFLGDAELTLLMPEHSESPERMRRFQTGRAEVVL